MGCSTMRSFTQRKFSTCGGSSFGFALCRPCRHLRPSEAAERQSFRNVRCEGCRKPCSRAKLKDKEWGAQIVNSAGEPITNYDDLKARLSRIKDPAPGRVRVYR